MFVLLVMFLSLSLILVGCAKKAAVKEVTEEKTTTVEKKAPVEPKEEKAAPQAEKEKPAVAAAAPVAAAVSPIAGFDYIYFDFDKFNIKPGARENLRKLADWMNGNAGSNILIEGNCDERGTVEYNLALGERRATSAMKYLTNLGIVKNRISTISYGKERPVDPGHDEAAWAKNRRDDFTVK
jgi:peptidoglycan-associated lipoprotein